MLVNLILLKYFLRDNRSKDYSLKTILAQKIPTKAIPCPTKAKVRIES